MERILIIGSPGAGKSTLSAELARIRGLPLIHLDQLHWRPGWIEGDKAEFAAELSRLMEQPRWLIDGNYGGTLPLRLQRADTVVYLDFPAWLCVTRIIRRAITYRGRVRPDMTAGCPERIDREFLFYTATFPWHGRKRIEAKLPSFRGKIIRLRSPKEVRRFLAGFKSGWSKAD